MELDMEWELIYFAVANTVAFAWIIGIGWTILGVLWLEEKVRVKEGKKKKTQIIETEISFDEIEKTIVKITFK